MLEVSPKSGATTLQEKDRVKLNLGLGAGNKYQYPNPREDEDIMPTDAMTPEELRHYEKMMGRGDVGAMTPDEEKMVSDYEEEEANKYALDSENPLGEASVILNHDEVYAKYAPLVKQYMKNGLNKHAAISKAEHVLAKKYSTTPLNIQSTISDYFNDRDRNATYGDKNPLDEASVILNRDEVYAKYAPLVKQYMKNGLDKYAAISKAQNVLAKEYGATPLNIQSTISDYFDDQYRNATYGNENPLGENMEGMPEDIEWMWDGEVYDRVDYHSGDIGLEGHSKSTGRDYTASVMADYNGDDWEWSDYDIENIEEVPVKEIKNKPTHLRERKEPLSKLIRKADRIVEAWNSKKLIKEADLSQANFDDLTQVVKNIAHINEVGMEEAAMQAIEYIAEQFDVPVDFKDFD